MKLITAKDLYLLSVITLIEAANRLSSGRLRPLFARGVAFLAYWLSRRKRRMSEKNVVQAFEGKLSRERARDIVKGSFYQFWLEIFSMPCSSGPEAADTISICGLEHLQDTLEQGKGAILWESSYFGRRNLAKYILHRNGFAIDQVHARNHMGGFAASGDAQSWTRDRVIRPFFDERQRSFVREIIYLTDPDFLIFARTMANRLRNNGILCISADGPRGHKFISVPFLGRTVSIPTGIASLAKVSGAPIMPLFCYADAKGRTSLNILPPVRIPSDLQREEALETTVLQFTDLLESYVRRYPEQYRNWHSFWGPPRLAALEAESATLKPRSRNFG
ncbi:MAG: lysophospholipid acyltransferase family protein [Candidatus Binatia bacterium]